MLFGGSYSNASTFVFGSELQGRGYSTFDDKLAGFVMLTLALEAVILGCTNLYFIKTMKIFHNAFGWFWASRTFGEIMINVIHAGFNAPVTILQPKNIPPIVGILPYIFAYIFATGSCFMHSIVSMNRCIAVYNPLQYKKIFIRRRCFRVIFCVWMAVCMSGAFLVVFPCNVIGYSPQLYEYIFVKCSPDLWRDFSIVGTTINLGCWTLCFCTLLTDIATLCRIVYIKKVLKLGAEDKNFRRDIRFFAQTSVQNITMIIATTAIVLANNRNHEGNKLLHVFGFDALLLTHVNNALSLLLFNPEVRNRILKTTRRTSTMSLSYKVNSNSLNQAKPLSRTYRVRTVSQLYANLNKIHPLSIYARH